MKPSTLALCASTLAAACGGGRPDSAARPAPQPIGNAGGTPAAAPRAIDVATFRAVLERGDWAPLIDPATGVVELHAVASAVDDKDSEFWVKRWCGDRAATVVQMVGVSVQNRAIEQPDAYQLACDPDAAYVTCYQAGLGEYDLGYTFRFAPRDGVYRLTGITTVDVGTTADTEEKNYEVELAKPGGC